MPVLGLHTKRITSYLVSFTRGKVFELSPRYGVNEKDFLFFINMCERFTIDEHLGCFQFGATTNKASVFEQFFLWIHAIISPGNMLWSGIAGHISFLNYFVKGL